MATNISNKVMIRKTVLPLFLDCFQILFIVAGNEDMREISKEFERPDPITDFVVSCHERHRLMLWPL